MQRCLNFLLLLLVSSAANAQFSSSGIITYERRTNIRMMLQQGNEWTRSMVKDVPAAASSYFTLKFRGERSVYAFDREDEGQNYAYLNSGPAKKNKVWTDYAANEVRAFKDIYETTFLVRDSVRQFRWKIGSEVRTIAGYPCRKAVTTICDSVVVVAFYTDQILLSGGPEGFNGLPGMILGLAVPRLYTTWFASEVRLDIPEEQAFVPSGKGKEVSYRQLDEVLRSFTAGRRGGSDNFLWWISL